MLDLLIQQGILVDGSGAPARRVDIGVENGKIVILEDAIEAPARHVVNAKGRLVTPGFVDIHRHADLRLFDPGFGEPELRQGITTVVNGSCGVSAVPCPPERREEILSMLQPILGRADGVPPAASFADYAACVKQTPLPLHVGMAVGNSTIHVAVKGYTAEPPAGAQLDDARSLLTEALDAGALGVTLGIGYTLEHRYTLEDFIQVLQPMRGRGVPLVTTLRGEGDNLHKSLREVLELARQLEVPLHISHLQCVGSRNWGRGMERALEILDAARESGMQITCDVYPYTANNGQLFQLLPPAYLKKGIPGLLDALRDENCRKQITAELQAPSNEFENLVSLVGWDNIVLSTLHLPQNQGFAGKSVTEIAGEQGKSPFDCVYDLLLEEGGRISSINAITSEQDIRTALQAPFNAVASNAAYGAEGILHPRSYGAFPKVLMEYVREGSVLRLEEAIYKMTALPASVFGLSKGVVRVGADADLNVFSLLNLRCAANYQNAAQFAEGFDYVFVGGKAAVEHDQLTGEKNGTLLERQPSPALV